MFDVIDMLTNLGAHVWLRKACSVPHSDEDKRVGINDASASSIENLLAALELYQQSLVFMVPLLKLFP